MNMELRVKRNIYIYYFSLVLLTIAISLPHSVLTVLLLTKGITLSQIMIIQAGYSFAILISEYPSGLIADIYSKKKVFIYSKFFLLMMFFIVISTNTFWILFIAWFMYGISSALDTGTIEAEIINHLKLSEGQIDKFLSNESRLSFISLLIGSSIGSFIYYKMGIGFYWISILLTIISIICVEIFYKEEMIENTKISLISLFEMFKRMLIQSREGIKEIKEKESLKVMIALTFVGQFFFQAHFQLWQALFLSKGINKHYFYMFYVVFQILSIFAYSIPVSKLSSNKHGKYFSILAVFLIFFLSLLNTTNNILFIIVYITYVFVFTVFDFISIYIFSKNVSNERISSLTSLKSSCGRVGSLISMITSSAILKLTSVTHTIMINFAFAMAITTLIIIKYLISEKIFVSFKS